MDWLRGTWRAGLLIVAALVCRTEMARAFPPAPFHTIYGLARNEFGQPLEGSDVKVLLESSSGQVLQSGVGWVKYAGANFEIQIPMDTGVFDAPYRPTAMRPTTPFRIKVMVGKTVLLPIEMKGDMKQLGKPGGQTRIDLTLGEDADGDGLPDAWERVVAAMLGLDSLDKFDADADSDGDGLSNRQEYLAGTYATDPADGFRLSIVEKREDGPVMEFLAIRGRTYTLQGSADLKAWSTLNFKLLGGTSDSVSGEYRAGDTRVVRIQGMVGDSGAGFFNLKVE